MPAGHINNSVDVVAVNSCNGSVSPELGQAACNLFQVAVEPQQLGLLAPAANLFPGVIGDEVSGGNWEGVGGSGPLISLLALALGHNILAQGPLAVDLGSQAASPRQGQGTPMAGLSDPHHQGLGPR